MVENQSQTIPCKINRREKCTTVQTTSIWNRIKIKIDIYISFDSMFSFYIEVTSNCQRQIDIAINTVFSHHFFLSLSQIQMFVIDMRRENRERFTTEHRHWSIDTETWMVWSAVRFHMETSNKYYIYDIHIHIINGEYCYPSHKWFVCIRAMVNSKRFYV